MSTPYTEDHEDRVLPPTALFQEEDENMLLNDEEEDGELSLEELEDEEEDTHRVITYQDEGDGRSYFDEAYFDS